MEIWDAYDEKGVKQEMTLVRGEKIPQGFYHLCVDVVLTHQDGSVLFMKRSQQKSVGAGYYEATAGGSCLAGEDSLTAAYRELVEETGIRPLTMEKIGEASFPEDQCHFHYYHAQITGPYPRISYQASETEGHVWVKPDQLDEFFEKNLTFSSQRELVLSVIPGKKWEVGQKSVISKKWKQIQK